LIFEELDMFVGFKHQVFDIPADENNPPYALTNLTDGSVSVDLQVVVDSTWI
jgi:hypothetical protein